MKIETGGCGKYRRVVLSDGGASIDLGMLNESECRDLARSFIDAAWQIGPLSSADCAQWFANILQTCGIELPQQEETT